MNVLTQLIENTKLKQKMLGVLIDPDRFSNMVEFSPYLTVLKENQPDYVFVGGSLINNNLFNEIIIALKQALSIPVIIFPGNNQQISEKADAILLLSLISGRNPDFIIGQHVASAFQLQRSKLELLSTGYILIDCGETTAAQYMSNTMAIPYTKNGIASATALAGAQLGLSLCYLDGGSGASKAIDFSMIEAVKKVITTPLIVGGGLKSIAAIKNAWEAGADIVMIGTAFEENPSIISEIR